MIAWPQHAFPDPLYATYSGETAVPVIRTAMDAGNIRQRNRFTTQLKMYKVKWSLRPAQWWAMQEWIRQNISNGADYFLMDLWQGSETPGLGTNMAVRFVNGMGGVTQTFQDGCYMVEATLEVQMPPTLTAQQLNLLLLQVTLDKEALGDYYQNTMANTNFYAGDLQLNDIFGNVALAVAASIQQLPYAFGATPTGANVIVQLLDQSNNLITSFTLPAGVQSGVITPPSPVPLNASPGTFYHWKITQLGSTVPGSDLSLSPIIY